MRKIFIEKKQINAKAPVRATRDFDFFSDFYFDCVIKGMMSFTLSST